MHCKMTKKIFEQKKEKGHAKKGTGKRPTQDRERGKKEQEKTESKDFLPRMGIYDDKTQENNVRKVGKGSSRKKNTVTTLRASTGEKRLCRLQKNAGTKHRALQGVQKMFHFAQVHQ